jgi:hypothetical protein
MKFEIKKYIMYLYQASRFSPMYETQGQRATLFMV